jgi:hypothetical protein
MEARPYPTHLLEGCETGLVLFAAAFLGHNDAVHFAEAGIDTTCVDTDGERLEEMAQLYGAPSDVWSFHKADAWVFAENCWAFGDVYDAVSVDTFTGDAMHRSLASLGLWCSLARKFVTVTITDDVESINVPEGWTSSPYPRSDHVSWPVLERD